jgi:hypothetical protein
MPVLIPSGLYSQGRFKVDLSPIDQVVRQRQAEKKAAGDAAMKYFSSLKDKINTSGVRTVDLEGGLQNQIDQWINQGTSNLDQISKGGQAYSDFLKGYQGILNNIEKSKSRAKFETDLGKAAFDGKYDPDVDDLHVLDKISKSIYDPASYKQDGVSEYGFADLPANVPGFDPNKQNQFFTAAFGKAKPTYDEKNARIDNATGDIFIPKEYTDSDVKSIADNALNVFYGDKVAQKYYKNQLANAGWLKKANDAYESIYGAGQVVDSPEKAVQADAIMRAKLSGEEVKVTDPNYAQKLRKEIAKVRSSGKKMPSAKAASDTIGSYYTRNAKKVTEDSGSDVNAVDYNDIIAEDLQYVLQSKVKPLKNSSGVKYYKINNDGTWEGENGIIPTRILNMKLKNYKTSSTSPTQSDIAQYPKNIQNGIMAFSQKNNLSLDDALSILKEQRPEIFS